MALWLRLLDRLSPRIDTSSFSDAFESLERLKGLTNQLEQMDVEIQRREKQLLSALDNIESAIWAKDADNRFVYVNQTCCDKILHCTKDEALQAKDTDFEENALAGICVRSDEITKERGETCRFIEHAVFADYDLWIDSIKSPWIKDGDVIGTVGTGKNITDVIAEEIRNRFKEPLLIEIPMDMYLDSEQVKKLVSTVR